MSTRPQKTQIIAKGEESVDFSQLKGNATLPRDRRVLLAALRSLLDHYGCRPCWDIEVEQFLDYRLADYPRAKVPMEAVRAWARELTRRKDRELVDVVQRYYHVDDDTPYMVELAAQARRSARR